ncbi:hypothetical protein ACN20G_07595 [Streptomyces sp. BI20]|uniref:hypothetical protein n=1 Tax=Streptomyces sp. BI20 TaxID=3403460 RepID=UPI003C714617
MSETPTHDANARTSPAPTGTPAEPLPRRRRGRALRAAAGLTVLCGVAGYVTVQYEAGSGLGTPSCVVAVAADAGGPGAGTSYRLGREQARQAATIAAVGTAKGVPERAVTIAVATAMQESSLRNIRYGDRDSLGLFQQRPSQGWGSPDEIMDPVYAAGIFYDNLVEVRDYQRLPLTVAAQKVQRSAFPDAYAKHERQAVLLAAAFTGRPGASVVCGGPAPTAPGDPDRVRTELTRAFGPSLIHPAGAAGATPVEAGEGPPPGAGTGAGPRTGGAEERRPEATLEPAGPTTRGEVRLRVSPPADPRPRTDREDRAPDRPTTREPDGDLGQAVARWVVAHAEDLRVTRVEYGTEVWTAGRNAGEWVPATAASRTPAAPPTPPAPAAEPPSDAKPADRPPTPGPAPEPLAPSTPAPPAAAPPAPDEIRIVTSPTTPEN